MTTDGGVSWTSSRLPNFGADSVGAIAASMPSQYACYLLAADNPFQTDDVLMKIAFAVPVDTGGHNGVVQNTTSQTAPFSAAYESNAISFTMAPAPDARSIQILDVLGRTCASIALAPNAASSQIATSALRTGTYFAKLDGSMVKFMIP
jgi:hypothetical protein